MDAAPIVSTNYKSVLSVRKKLKPRVRENKSLPGHHYTGVIYIDCVGSEIPVPWVLKESWGSATTLFNTFGPGRRGKSPVSPFTPLRPKVIERGLLRSHLWLLNIQLNMFSGNPQNCICCCVLWDYNWNKLFGKNVDKCWTGDLWQTKRSNFHMLY